MNNMPPSPDWEKLHEVIHSFVVGLKANQKIYSFEANDLNLSLPEYVAGKLIRASQEIADYTFSRTYRWPSLYEVVRSHFEFYEAHPLELQKQAKRRSLSKIEYITSELFHVVGMGLDFESFLKFNSSCSKAS